MTCVKTLGTQQDPEFVFVNKTMTWPRAQSYCRENFRDLVTVRNDNESLKVQNLAQRGNRTWISLNGHFNVYWSDGSSSKNFFWDYTYQTNQNGPVACIVVVYGYYNIFDFHPCAHMHQFVCYSRPLPTAGECFTVLQWKRENDRWL